MWFSSQNDQNTYRRVIQLIGIAFFGFTLAACNNLTIHQLGRNNQDNLKKIVVSDIETREGQIYTHELRKK